MSRLSSIPEIGFIYTNPINIVSIERKHIENNDYTINKTTLYTQLNFSLNNSSNNHTLTRGQCLKLNNKQDINILYFFSTETDPKTKTNYYCVYIECDDTSKIHHIQDVLEWHSFEVISCPEACLEASTEGGKRKKHKKSKKKLKKGGKKSRRKTIRHL